MSDPPAIGGVPARLIDSQFLADPDAPAATPGVTALSMPSAPSTSPAMRRLRRELEDAVANATPGSAEQDLASRILRGETGLREVLSDPALPTPDRARIHPSLRALIDDLHEEGPQ